MDVRELGRIESVYLGFNDHNIFIFMLDITFDGKGPIQGFGNYNLKHPAYGIPFLTAVLEALGVQSWADLIGQPVWCYRRTPGTGIFAIEAPEYRKGKKLTMTQAGFELKERGWIGKPKKVEIGHIPVCPECSGDDWEFIGDNQFKCANCGHIREE